jgi:uncharacterized protein Smg (DUF494 family)
VLALRDKNLKLEKVIRNSAEKVLSQIGFKTMEPNGRGLCWIRRIASYKDERIEFDELRSEGRSPVKLFTIKHSSNLTSIDAFIG